MDDTDQYKRFKKPNEGQQYESEYDISSGVIYDPIERGTQPLSVVTIDLSTAGTRQINVPGRSFVPYFWQTNTANRARQLTGLINVAVNQDGQNDPSQIFPAKYNRGFRGSFTKLNLSWAAQTNTSVDFVIHRSKYTPWMTDDFESSTGSTGDLTDTGTDGIVITGGTGAVNGSGTTIAQHVADSTHNGYLSSTDWVAFNAKQPTVTVTAPLVKTVNNLSIPAATGSMNGYLTSADWTTFNGKQNALTIGNLTAAGTDGIVVTGGTGAVIGSGTSIAQHVADATHNGYLAQADFARFTTVPTVQILTASSGSYTPPATALYLRVRAVGGGGGGAGSPTFTGSTDGIAGGSTTLGAILTCGGGDGGSQNNSVNHGGTISLTTGSGVTKITADIGAGGQGGGTTVGGLAYSNGGQGGQSPFGGAGSGGPITGPGSDAAPNTGSGGGGANGNGSASAQSGQGGASGGFSEFIVAGATLAAWISANPSFTVGAGGAGGAAAASGTVGGAGADGKIEVVEYYS